MKNLGRLYLFFLAADINISDRLSDLYALKVFVA